MYYTTKITSPMEAGKILNYASQIVDLGIAWPWWHEINPIDLVFHCHIYRIDSDRWNAVNGTRDPLGLFLLSGGEFYVINLSATPLRDRLKIFQAFVDACDFPLKTYIPANQKALIRLCKKYGFTATKEPGYYVKNKTTGSRTSR